LALADMDYRHVKEPDYNPEKIRQTKDTTEYIKRLVELVMEAQGLAPEIRAFNRNKGGFANRDLRIFYDTSGIVELQREKLCVCSECSGTLGIDSNTDQGTRIHAVHIPRKACKRCQEQGYQWFDSANARKYDSVCLQDRTQDRYFVKKR
ncbi:MAG: histone deacetylase, partial [Syntrophobacteraceae bacterium]|nr:histone deacetylase [Syntrophobacteraceae bacterium]